MTANAQTHTAANVTAPISLIANRRQRGTRGKFAQQAEVLNRWRTRFYGEESLSIEHAFANRPFALRDDLYGTTNAAEKPELAPAPAKKPARKTYTKVDRQVEGKKLHEAGAITLHGDSATCNNGKGKTYTITLGDSPTCTCPDWTGKGPGHACKHIIAAELAQAAEPTPTEVPSLETLEYDELCTVERQAFEDIRAGRDADNARATLRRISEINRQRRADAPVLLAPFPDLDNIFGD